MFLLLFIQVLWVLVALRRKRPDLPRRFRVPGVPFVPVVGILLQLALAVALFFYSPLAWVSAGAWIALGVVVFYAYSRRRDRAYTHLVEARRDAEERKYRILACVGDGARAGVVLRAAAMVARHYKGELVALTVAEVPDRHLLATGLARAVEKREALVRTVSETDLGGVPVKVVAKVSHRISYGITETALEERCNLIVIGRPRRSGLAGRIAATITDRVVRSAPAQVMVVMAESWPEAPRSLLLAHERGPNSGLAADLAEAFGAQGGAAVRAVHVKPWSASDGEVAAAGREMAADLGGRGRTWEMKVARDGGVVPGLLRAGAGADLMVLGGTEAGFVEQILGYSPPLELAVRTHVPVIAAYEMAANPRRWMI
jgi:nucleotide-binding universal stress UspA family protein